MMRFDPSEELSPFMARPFTQAVLDRVKMLATARVGRYVLDSARVEVIRDLAARDLMYGLTTYVLSQNLPPVAVTRSQRRTDEVTAFRPATWVDHFKLTYAARWWARWWVRRHPARTVEVPHRVTRTFTVSVDLTRYRTYPHADVPVPPDFGPVVYSHSLHTTEGWH